MMDFGVRRKARRPSLTPMIDVVFLLLVFFMLAARFGVDMTLPLTLAGSAGDQSYSGPPRLVDVLPEGIRLNGAAIDPSELAGRLEGLTESSEDVVVLRALDGAVLQRLVDTIALLEDAGFSAFVIAE